MKYLFIHQNFPGQYLHLVRHLVQAGGHEIVFISEDNANLIPGVRRVIYRMPRHATEQTHPGAREFDLGLVRADAVAKAASTLRDLGFEPDIIIGHHGWGELLNIQDVFPGVPVLGYFEFYYHDEPGFDVGFDPEFPMQPAMMPLVRAKNAINLQALTSPGYGQTPTEFQKSAYPDWAREKITVLREGVDLELCRPDATAHRRKFSIKDVHVSPKEKLITYVSRDLEPYRGFHVFMRALPRILREQPDARVIMVGGDGVSYGARLPSGSWRERMLEELAGELDLSRIHFVGKVSYDDFLRLLQRSDTHVYLTYPFVASWSLREAMAAGCAIVGSATAPVEEFIEDGVTGRLVPFTEPDRIAEGVLELLNDTRTAKKMRQEARAEAERTLCMKAYLARYEDLISQLITAHKAAPVLQENAAEADAPRNGTVPKRGKPKAALKAKPDAVKAEPVTPAKKPRQPVARKTAPVRAAAKQVASASSKTVRTPKSAAQAAPRVAKGAAVRSAPVKRAAGRRKKADQASS
ncbi:glycosyltransferase [Acetobacter persici]|uniref:glycosyltransferase n=1 Tax=Acetobacter persici TaxID=1076596 RepID=UPI0039ED4EBE